MLCACCGKPVTWHMNPGDPVLETHIATGREECAAPAPDPVREAGERLANALASELRFVRLADEPPPIQTCAAILPAAERARQAAVEIERRDAEILEARAALQRWRDQVK